MDNMPHTTDVQDAADQATRNQESQQFDEIPEAPAQTEFELHGKMTFGRETDDLDKLMRNVAIGYLREDELSAIRRLSDVYYRYKDMEEQFDQLSFKKRRNHYLRRIIEIIQSSKSRNGFSQKNWRTQHVYSNENVNEYTQLEDHGQEEQGLLDKIKGVATGERAQELSRSMKVDDRDLAVNRGERNDRVW